MIKGHLNVHFLDEDGNILETYHNCTDYQVNYIFNAFLSGKIKNINQHYKSVEQAIRVMAVPNENAYEGKGTNDGYF